LAGKPDSVGTDTYYDNYLVEAEKKEDVNKAISQLVERRLQQRNFDPVQLGPQFIQALNGSVAKPSVLLFDRVRKLIIEKKLDDVTALRALRFAVVMSGRFAEPVAS